MKKLLYSLFMLIALIFATESMAQAYRGCGRGGLSIGFGVSGGCYGRPGWPGYYDPFYYGYPYYPPYIVERDVYREPKGPRASDWESLS